MERTEAEISAAFCEAMDQLDQVSEAVLQIADALACPEDVAIDLERAQAVLEQLRVGRRVLELSLAEVQASADAVVAHAATTTSQRTIRVPPVIDLMSRIGKKTNRS